MNDPIIYQRSKCPQCGASLPQPANRCAYCGSIFSSNTLHAQPSHSPDFGIKAVWPLNIAFFVTALLYSLGWFLEDTQYYLAAPAVTIWAVVIPLWLVVFAFIWQAQWGQWLPGFAIAFPIFFFHAYIIYRIRGSLNKDAVGMAALFALAALAGWAAGRMLHNYIRRIIGLSQK